MGVSRTAELLGPSLHSLTLRVVSSPSQKPKHERAMEANRRLDRQVISGTGSGNECGGVEGALESSSTAPMITNFWASDWLWGLPLIVLSVIMHVYVLGLINKKIMSMMGSALRLWEFPAASVSVVGGTVLSVTILHGFEGAIWAVAYRLLGAMPDNKSAMLYSLNAITTYGHDNLHLEPGWQMMGALEALNGCIMFGLTTAFLFTVIQKAWPRT
jgi:hypothetical protein